MSGIIITRGTPVPQSIVPKPKLKLAKADFQTALAKIFADATAAGEKSIDVLSGSLHNTVGGYPGTGHSMPTCCLVMYDQLRPGDIILGAPPKGKGATVRIRYQLPR